MRVATATWLIIITLGCSSTTVESNGAGPEASRDPDSFDDDPVTIMPDSGDGGEPGEPVDSAFQGPDDLIVMGADAAGDGDLWVPEAGDFVLRDMETGSLWNLRGQAFEGEMSGAQLGQVAAYTVFWFSWSTAHHGGEVWNRPEIVNDPGEIAADEEGGCEVPCDEIRSGGPPPDGIPTLDHAGRCERPKEALMVSAEEATYVRDDGLVLGVFIDGEARAYPHAILNWHENHIDQIGEAEYNMTYCPLTGSGIVIPADQGGEAPMYMYVSGRLFNDNLTMFERGPSQQDATFWNQVLLKGIAGPRAGEKLDIWPVTETTWARWKEMHPGTLVESDDTGYSRDYGRNPYTSNQQPTAGTLRPVAPQWRDTYDNKSKVLAIDGPQTSRAYAFDEMEAAGDRLVINDSLDDTDIVVIYDAAHRMAVPFGRSLDGQTFTFEGAVAP